jgi:hypothetical protein
VYYADCVGADLKKNFYKNNLQEAKGSPKVSDINAHWVFGDRWNPLTQ